MHLPSSSHGAVNERFVAGNPLTGQRATIVTPEILNAVVYEIANVITAAGIELEPGNETQLVNALLTLVMRTIRTGARVCIDMDALEMDGGELDENGNVLESDADNVCFPVEFDASLTLDQLKSELEYYDDIDSGAV